MAEPIRYYSTNRDTPKAGFGEAVLQGLAPDRGLFMPDRFPSLTKADLGALADKSYAEIAHSILRRFTSDVIDEATSQALCEEAYGFDVPLEHVTGRRHLLRLDQGPTASFKDFAARMMARWMNVLMRAEDADLVILTATSGDTGSAVAHALARSG